MTTPQQPQHGFFLLIPAFIADDPDIDDATAMLYGRIVALSNQKGHCWASDKYLAELTRVKEREVQNRLKVLEDKGYIVRDSERKGFSWSRKIYPNHGFQKDLTKRTSVHNDTHTCAPPNRTPVLHNNISLINKDDDDDSAQARDPKKTERCSIKQPDGKEIPMSKEELYEKAVLAKKDWSAFEIEFAWNKIKDYPNPISDIIKYSEAIINNERLKKKNHDIKKFNETKECNHQKTKKYEKKESKMPLKEDSNTISEPDTSEHPLANWRSIKTIVPEFMRS
jgi:hypothetical protein